jgi:hypothetical protein
MKGNIHSETEEEIRIWQKISAWILTVFFTFYTLFSETYLRREIPVANRKELRPIIDETCAEYFNEVVKVKSKVVPVLFITEHHAMKAYWGSGVIDPRILLPRN